MSELYNILDELKSLGFVLNPPANKDQIEYLLGSLGRKYNPWSLAEPELPEDILELYRHHNGMPLHHRFRLFETRLMSIEELVIYHHLLQWTQDPILREDCMFLWFNDAAPAMGMYVEGKLEDKIFIWDEFEEEYERWVPRFRSVESLYRHGLNFERLVKQQEENPEQMLLLPTWQNSHTDYPQFAPSDYDAEDLSLALEFIELAQNTNDNKEQEYYKCTAINLMPFEEREQLIPFLSDENSSVQYYAERIFQVNLFTLVNTYADIAEETVLTLAKKLEPEKKYLIAPFLSGLGC